MIIKNSELSEQPIPQSEMLVIANQLIQSLKNRDWVLLRALVTTDCIWRLPGTSSISGVAIGVDSIVKRAAQTNAQGFTMLHILYGTNGFALSLYNQESKNDLIIDEYLTMTCILRGYQISAINTYLSSMDSMESFFHY